MECKQFGSYFVYENGEIYSTYSNKFLSHDTSRLGYHQVTLTENKQPTRYKVHRLVGMLFLDCPDNYKELQINHIDGNKDNNHYSNLEWCTPYENNKHARDTGLNKINESNSKRWKDKEWAEKTAANISKARKEQGVAKGKKNPRFRYLATDNSGKEYSRQELAELCNVGLSTIDRYLRQTATENAKISKFIEHGITVIDTKSKS